MCGTKVRPGDTVLRAAANSNKHGPPMTKNESISEALIFLILVPKTWNQRLLRDEESSHQENADVAKGTSAASLALVPPSPVFALPPALLVEAAPQPNMM